MSRSGSRRSPTKAFPKRYGGSSTCGTAECRGGGVVDEEKGAASTYVISAPYSRWREVLEGDLDPIRGMMQGKLRVQGDLPTIIRYVSAANELVHLTGTVDTQFPDGD